MFPAVVGEECRARFPEHSCRDDLESSVDLEGFEELVRGRFFYYVVHYALDGVVR